MITKYLTAATPLASACMLLMPLFLTGCSDNQEPASDSTIKASILGDGTSVELPANEATKLRTLMLTFSAQVKDLAQTGAKDDTHSKMSQDPIPGSFSSTATSQSVASVVGSGKHSPTRTESLQATPSLPIKHCDTLLRSLFELPSIRGQFTGSDSIKNIQVEIKKTTASDDYQSEEELNYALELVRPLGQCSVNSAEMLMSTLN